MKTLSPIATRSVASQFALLIISIVAAMFFIAAPDMVRNGHRIEPSLATMIRAVTGVVLPVVLGTLIASLIPTRVAIRGDVLDTTWLWRRRRIRYTDLRAVEDHVDDDPKWGGVRGLKLVHRSGVELIGVTDAAARASLQRTLHACLELSRAAESAQGARESD